MTDDPYASSSDFDLALPRERERTLASAATGTAADLSTPRVRRIYTPLHPAGVGTGGTQAVRQTVTRDILQDALSQADIDLDPPTYSPAGLGSPSPTPPPP